MKALVEIQYFPPLEYFCVLLQHAHVTVEAHEHYVKQSYRNRCYILTANGVLKLVVPITAKSDKALTKQVQIDNSTKWQNIHWRAIQSAYGKAPFFDHYSDRIHQILFSDHELLYDLNYELLSFCLQSLQCQVSLSATNSFEKVPKAEIIDLRSAISPKKSFDTRSFYLPTKYIQVFGNKFVANLSILDLLFCEGPNAIQILQSSTPGYLNK